MSCQPPNEIQLLCKILIASLLTKSLSYFQNFPFKYESKYGNIKVLHPSGLVVAVSLKYLRPLLIL